jgi:hypothetical protein
MQLANFLRIISILLETTNVWLFHMTEAYSIFDLIKELYEIIRLSKNEKIYVMQ